MKARPGTHTTNSSSSGVGSSQLLTPPAPSRAVNAQPPPLEPGALLDAPGAGLAGAAAPQLLPLVDVYNWDTWADGVQAPPADVRASASPARSGGMAAAGSPIFKRAAPGQGAAGDRASSASPGQQHRSPSRPPFAAASASGSPARPRLPARRGGAHPLAASLPAQQLHPQQRRASPPPLGPARLPAGAQPPTHTAAASPSPASVGSSALRASQRWQEQQLQLRDKLIAGLRWAPTSAATVLWPWHCVA
jgi:hypothetical protein